MNRIINEELVQQKRQTQGKTMYVEGSQRCQKSKSSCQSLSEVFFFYNHNLEKH